MIARGLLAATLVVGALAGPAGAAPAEQADDCTSEFVDWIVDGLFTANPEPNPYPLVEVEPNGTIQVHPQNAVPAAMHAISPDSYSGAVVARTAAYVDCVD